MSSLVNFDAQTPIAARERADALEAAKRYAKKSRADSTWRAYASDWGVFEKWCEKADLNPLPADAYTLALFIAREADLGKKPSTLQRRLSAIRMVHKAANLPSAHGAIEVVEIMTGIRRQAGAHQNQKAPALAEDICQMVDACDLDTKTGLRDRALLLMGFSGAFRRSELVGLTVGDINRIPEQGIEITIRQSKTDQEKLGQTIAILLDPDSLYCPVSALQIWLESAQITTGPLFTRISRGDHIRDTALSSQSVALIVKKYAHAVGLDAKNFAGHSLRSGFLTSAAKNRATVFKMQEVSRHKSIASLQTYVRDRERFDDHAGANLFRMSKAIE